VSLTSHAIDRNRVTWIVLLLILLGGLAAYGTMSRSEDPGFIIRDALVTTMFPGASPERVEQLVTDKLEKVIQEIPELDSLRSDSRTGLSVIRVAIREEYTNIRPIWDDLRRKVEKAKKDLPDDVIGPIVNDEFGDVFGIILGITGSDFEYRELKEIADEVRDELLLQLRQILQARNIVIPGGEIRTEFEEFVLEPSGNFISLEEVGSAVIQLPGQDEVLYLRDIADRIYRGYIDPAKTKMSASGMRALGLGISMREGGNVINLGREVEGALARVQGYYPVGIEFDTLQFQPRAVENKIQEFQNNLIQAILIVTLVMLLSLGLRTGLVVATLIPMAMLSTLGVMAALGIGLDQLSIASLIISL